MNKSLLYGGFSFFKKCDFYIGKFKYRFKEIPSFNSKNILYLMKNSSVIGKVITPKFSVQPRVILNAKLTLKRQ